MAIARRTGGIVINADSAQIYADLRIVTARPSEAEESALPHRLFGYIDGAEACSAARWAADAMTSIETAEKQGKPAILVGGTGLYHRTLLEGIAPIPDIDPAIRAAVRALAVADAYEALRSEDREAATRLKPADTTRVARALEVVRSTGRPIAAWQKEKSGGIADRISLAPLILLPNRDWLYARCDARFADMLESGAVDEVETLAARNLDPDLPIMRAIGVPEIIDFLVGNSSKQETIAAAAQATRRYAKRQYTWFSNQPPADWPRIDESQYNDYIDKIVTILQ